MSESRGPAYEKKKKRERELEREVLQHLRSVNQPVKLAVLVVHFDQNQTADIRVVLQELKAGHYIAVDGKNNVTITEIGLMRLRAAMF